MSLVFVVHNPIKGQVWVFDNHDAARRCRQEQKLSHWHLWGCVVFNDWKDGVPLCMTGEKLASGVPT